MAKTNTIYVNDSTPKSGTSANDKFVVSAGVGEATIAANGKGVDSIYFKNKYTDSIRANNTNDKFTYSTAENHRDLIITRRFYTFTLPDEPVEFDTFEKGFEAGYAFLGQWYKKDEQTDTITLKNYFDENGGLTSSVKTLQFGAETLSIIDVLSQNNFESPITEWIPNSKGVITGTALRDKIAVDMNDDASEIGQNTTLTINADTGNDVVSVVSVTEDELSPYYNDINQKINVNGGDGDDTITVFKGINTTINGGNGDDRITVGNTPNTVEIIYSNQVFTNKITTGNGTNEVHVVSSFRNTETIINPTKGEDLTIYYEASSASGSTAPEMDAPTLADSDFEIYRNGNDMIVERSYEANFILDSDGNPLDQNDMTQIITDRIVIKDIVTKYDASSLNVVVGDSMGQTLFDTDEPDQLIKYFTFDLIKGTVYNESTQTYEDIKYYTYDQTDLKNKKKLNATAHDEEIDLSEYKKNAGITINAGAGDDKITGTKNADVINTGSGNNTIDGGKGNDTIKLGNGLNSIKFGTGSGHDTVYNSTYDGTTLELTDENVDEMEDLSFVKNGNNLDVKLNSGDYVTLYKYFTMDALDNIKFADGTVGSINDYLSQVVNYDANTDTTGFVTASGNATGTDFFNNYLTGNTKANKINGANNADCVDILEGGKGNDTLSGGKGTNFLVFQKGDGKDTVKLSSDENLHLVYKAEAGVTPGADDFTYTRSGKDVVIARTGTTDTITLKNMAYAAPESVKLDIYNLTGDEYDAATTVDLYDHEYKVAGKAKNAKKGIGATVTGSSLKEEITGTKYKDTLTSGSGEQTLIGGKGNDTLISGAGATTFIFSSGDGLDVVKSADNQDTLKFTDVDVETDDLTLSADKNSLKLSYASGDTVTLTDWFTATDFVKDVAGAQDSTLDLTNLHSQVAAWMSNSDYTDAAEAMVDNGADITNLQAYLGA